jgi:hypothetical protein
MQWKKTTNTVILKVEDSRIMMLAIILNTIFLLLVSLSISISILVLVIICIYIRLSASNTSFLLICNTYFTMILLALTLLDICGHRLYGHIDPSIRFDGQRCEIRAYFVYVCFCAFYYSFILQAIFRLFRIVFYKMKILQSFRVFIIAIVIQWTLSLIFILPHIILRDFQYQSLNYNCWISFKNLRGMFLATLNIYGCPLMIIFIIYTYIHRYIRRTINIRQKRRIMNRRNMIILRRTIILLLFLVLIGVPTLSVLMIYIITDYLTPFVYDIQSVNISLGLVITPITLIFITPKIRRIFRRNRKQKYRISTTSTPSELPLENL